MNILVVGGFGFIGTRLVDLLFQEGHSVFILDRSSSLYHCAEIRQPQLRLSNATVDSLFKHVPFDSVYYLASQLLPATNISASTIGNSIGDDLISALRIAYAARDAGVSKFIFASSGGSVYEDRMVHEPYAEDSTLGATNAYGANKLAIEFHLKVLNHVSFRTISARMSNPYYFTQPKHKGQGIIPAFIQNHIYGKPLTIFGDGLNVRDFIYLDDACRALTAMTRYNGTSTTFNIGSGLPHTILDVVRYIEAASNQPAKLVFQPSRSVDKRYAVVSCTHAQRELNWAATIPLDKGIQSCYQSALVNKSGPAHQ